MPAPVFLLAFAYDPTEALPKVVEELKNVQRLLSQTGGNAETLWQATPDDLAERFDTQRADLRIFHYSGHANPAGLQLNADAQGASRIVLSSGLALKAGRAKSLRLVFLNGCSTREQAQVFLNRGVPAVIATTKPLLDRYGVDFARRFYQSFTRRNSLNTLQEAFEEAFISFTDANGELSLDMFDEKVRGSIDLEQEMNTQLYELHLHPDPTKKAVAEERFTDWFAAAPPETPRNTETPPEEPQPTPPTFNGEPSQVRTKIQDLVSQGRLEEALNALVKIAPDAILLQGQYASAKRENNMGLLDGDDWRRTVARITHAVLEMARSV